MITTTKYSYSDAAHKLSISVNDKFVTTLFNVKLIETFDSPTTFDYRIVTYKDETTIAYIMMDDIVIFEWI